MNGLVFSHEYALFHHLLYGVSAFNFGLTHDPGKRTPRILYEISLINKMNRSTAAAPVAHTKSLVWLLSVSLCVDAKQ